MPDFMETCIHRALSKDRVEIRGRWETLLRIERVNTPLANPDALVHLFDWTLDEVFSKLGGPHDFDSAAGRAFEGSVEPFACECGRNPFVAYFKAARQALIETLVLEQAEMPKLDPIDRDRAMAELRSVVDTLTQSEVSAFCALCTHRGARGVPHAEREFGFSAEEG